MNSKLDLTLTRAIAWAAVLLIGTAVVMAAHATDRQDAAQWASNTVPSQNAAK